MGGIQVCQGKERIGLYLMVFVILMNTCDTQDRLEAIEESLVVRPDTMYVMRGYNDAN